MTFYHGLVSLRMGFASKTVGAGTVVTTSMPIKSATGVFTWGKVADTSTVSSGVGVAVLDTHCRSRHAWFSFVQFLHFSPLFPQLNSRLPASHTLKSQQPFGQLEE